MPSPPPNCSRNPKSSASPQPSEAASPPLIHQILKENRRASLPSQWATLIPTLTEALAPESDPTPTKPDRPRRLLTLKQGLTIRREKCIGGWSLKFTGPHARSGGLIDDVMDEIERLFQPE